MKTTPASLLTRSMIPAIFAILLSGAGTALAFNGGDGSPTAPYQVATAAHLDAVRNDLTAHYVQTADIDLGVAPWNEGAGWVPIGGDGNPFTGVYDGGGHRVQGLFINRGSSDHQGLFGLVSGAQAGIANLTIEGFSITARTRIGGLAGQLEEGASVANCHSSGTMQAATRSGGLIGSAQYGASIVHCTSSASVSATGERIGGLAGQLFSSAAMSHSHATGPVSGGTLVGGLVGNNSTDSRIQNCSATGDVEGGTNTGGLVGNNSTESRIQNCWATGDVEGGTNTGGLVGQNWGSEIHTSYATGEVTGTTQVGGLVGYNVNSGLITDSYSHAAVQGTSQVGGLVGYNHFSNSGARVYRSYSTGTVTGDTSVGGLIGQNSGSIHHSFWDMESSVMETSAGGTGKTTAEMKEAATFRGFNFNTVWTIEEGVSYPSFQDLGSRSLGPDILALTDLEGSGTEEAPYRITTASELHAVRLDLTAHYRLDADIDLTDTAVWDGGRGWEPIGSGAGVASFTGVFDGNGHILSGLTVNRPTSQYQGLFGYCSAGAQLNNIRLTGMNVQGGQYSGGLVGCITGGVLIDRCAVQGEVVSSVTSTTGNTGGLVGYMTGSMVQGCSADVIVVGTSNTGGLVGINTASGSEIRNSYSTGQVTGTTSVGGLVGYNYNGPIISDSYSHAVVHGTSSVGGLVGYNRFFNTTPWILRSYSTGAVTGGTSVGGLVGQNNRTVNHSFWDMESSLMPTSAGGTGKTTTQMKEAATFRGFNFNTVWTIEEGVSYPSFQDLGSLSSGPDILALTDLEGSGTEEAPYRITTASELHAVRLDLTAHYRLDADIDLKDTAVWDGGRGWEPIGSGSGVASFTGVFDGNGHILSGLTINRPTSQYQGLFGYCTAGAQLKNIRLTGMNVQGGRYSGGLVGYITGGVLIDRCAVQGEVVSTAGDIGGLVGYMTGSMVQGCSADVTVVGASNTGGLVGINTASGSEIRNSYSTGQVTGTTSVGGLVGYNYNGPIISDSYSHAVVHGTSSVGGLVGYNRSFNTTTRILRSYSTGAVTGGTSVGGLVGQNNSTVNHSFWDMESSLMPTSAGGTGKTTTQMKEQATFTDAEWDFLTVWAIESSVNDGYPFLIASTRHALVYTADAGGSIDGPATQSVAHGEDGEAVTAVADTGWLFVQWSDGITTAERQELNVTETLELTAEFARIYYTLAYTAGEGGSIDGPATQSVAHGEDGEAVTAVADTGWLFVQWSDGITTAERQETNVTISVEVTAEFARNEHSVSYSAGEGGWIDGVSPQTIGQGEDGAAVTAVADSGWYFLQWSDGLLTATRQDLNVGGPIDVTALFVDLSEADFAGGSGTVQDPYRVATALQLFAVRLYPDAHFVQIADIALGVAPWTDAGGWVPIGTVEAPFIGSYNGGGFGVSGMRIDRALADRQGLFGQIAGALLANLEVTDFALTGGNRCGGLVGDTIDGSRVTHCGSSGTVTAVSRAGGLVGSSGPGGKIEHSHSSAMVTGSGDRIGGLAGQSWSDSDPCLVAYSHATGDVSGYDWVGGLVGFVRGSEVNHSSAEGAVAGNQQVGGLIGWLYEGSASDNHAVGNVAGNQQVGGLIGRASESFLSASHASGTVEGDQWVGGLVGSVVDSTLSGCRAMGSVVGTAGLVGGLAGYNGGSISGSHATGAVTGGDWIVGGLAGHNFGSISGSHATGDVYSPAARVGGLVGNNAGTIADSYATGRSESGIGAVGGIAGINFSVIVRCRAYGDVVAGNLAAGYGAGGLAGYHGLPSNDPDYNPLIEDSHASGNVSVNLAAGSGSVGLVGGLVGYVVDGGKIHRAYASGVIEGDATWKGGLIGWLSEVDTEVVASYWDMNTTGQTTSDGGEGRSTEEMTYPHDPDTYVGWDFTEVWAADLAGTENGGYPYLRSLVPGPLPTGEEMLANPSFNEEMGAGWELTAQAQRHMVFDVTGQADLHVSGFIGCVIWQDFDLAVSGGTSFDVAMRLGRDFAPEGVSTEVRLAYQDGEGQSHSITVLAPDNSEVAFFPETTHFTARVALPEGATRLLAFCAYRAGPGMFFATEFSLKQVESAVAGPYTLRYQAGHGGSISGPQEQTVAAGASGAIMIAIAEAGAQFAGWSDGVADNPRQDLAVSGPIDATAHFRSTGGVDIDWYAGHGIAPGAGQTWADLDLIVPAGKTLTLQQHFVAMLDPHDPQSRFASDAPVRVGTAMEIHFQPSLPDRRYTLWMSTDLAGWLPVPGQINVPGGNGPLVDAAPPVGNAFYRVEAALP